MNRRQSAVIRIIAWTIAAVALTVILILGLFGKINVISIGINTVTTMLIPENIKQEVPRSTEMR